jgi:hypothetical protein
LGAFQMAGKSGPGLGLRKPPDGQVR